MRKILVLDNYDSFTYNLVHYIEAEGNFDVVVARNDAITPSEAIQYDRIVLSPGPGLPDEAGVLKAIILNYRETQKILGVCLGQQAIGEVFGGRLKNLNTVYHGVATNLHVLDRKETLFTGLPDTFRIGHYHSWVIDKENLPADLTVTAVDDDGEIMAVRHQEHDICGVQFHPESVLTEYGRKLIDNWLYL